RRHHDLCPRHAQRGGYGLVRADRRAASARHAGRVASVTAMAHSADAWHAGTGGPGRDDLVPRPAADRSSAVRSGARTVRSWPLLVLAAPAAAEVWSGWTGIAQKTGFGLVSPLPGIWPSLHLDTAITLPVGVEAYAAYALRAWLAREHSASGRTR